MMAFISKMKLGRAALWVLCMMLLAYLLDVEWTWRIFTLCFAACPLDAVIYADYSSVGAKTQQ